ncbi:MAG TPA: hypothetical protein DIU15_15990 [Deltaproteobacteria bacterium]|nr:hypothetical protein [Deltaproteobacteria bacterium]HCP47542.1 hypothetical protein [Deltaproteobacteria bacterium]
MTPEQQHDWKIQRLESRCRGEEVAAGTLLDLAEAYFQMGYYFDAGDPWFRKGMDTAQTVIDQFEASSRAFNIIANSCYGLGEIDQAEQNYHAALRLEPTDSLAHVGLGNLHKERGQHGRAIDAFGRAAELDPDLWQAHYNLGGALYAAARERDFHGSEDLLQRAVYHLVTALRLEPFESFLGNIYKDLGELFLHSREYTYARRFFNRLVNHEEFGGIAHYYLGLTHYSMGRYTGAIHHYREFLKSEPESALAQSKIALAYLELGQWDQARGACERALTLEPANVLARFSMGCIDLDQRLYRQAAHRFRSLLEEDPDYFPAYVELVKTRYLEGNHGWLFEQLKAEIRRFEAGETFEGGRQYYKGDRGRARRMVDVLLAQIQELGIDAFASLSEVVEDVQTDSLRFQIWEQLYDLSRTHRVEQVLDQLETPGQWFGRQLGRTVLLLSQFLPEDAITSAFHVHDDALKRRAQSRRSSEADLNDYLLALDDVRSELREFQAYLLLALAVKDTPSAEDFLSDYLESDERELRASSAVSLLFYGSERAIRMLRQEADDLPEPHASRLRELVELGIGRAEQESKVIDLAEAAQALPPRPPRAEAREKCTLCDRSKHDVDRLMSGNRVYLCNLCVSYIHQQRQELLVPDQEEHTCSFCGSSTFEVEGMRKARDLLLCDRCLETCVSLLAKEEVERFLRGFH